MYFFPFKIFIHILQKIIFSHKQKKAYHQPLAGYILQFSFTILVVPSSQLESQYFSAKRVLRKNTIYYFQSYTNELLKFSFLSLHPFS